MAVANGRELLARSERETAHRHGAALLEQIDDALEQANAGQRDISAIGVGTGPGSFTGLRVGMATAKTIAYLLDVPIVGHLERRGAGACRWRALGDSSSFRQAPRSSTSLPLATNRCWCRSRTSRSGSAIASSSPWTCPTTRLLAQESRTRGSDAVAHLADALVELLDERLSAGTVDDVTTLVPAYVALPRGISAATAEVEWSPDLR